ncbi:MAG: HD family hydrolase [Anaerolineales bacterium]|nr:HD family hydrolase [Anaerolineales bacterium]MCB8950475.1 HD family hydrolase [Ardenticatenales bacterium]
MDLDPILHILRHGNQLKRTARTGWVQRGVPTAEDVAAHSYGAAFTALVLAHLVAEPVDLGRLLSLAILHDLPESLTTDIPSPAWQFLPPGIKTEVERGAMHEILAGAPFQETWMGLWEELHANETTEARLVHDADKLDMYVQALMYEQQTGNRHLGEFWDPPARMQFPISQAIYEALCQERQ